MVGICNAFLFSWSPDIHGAGFSELERCCLSAQELSMGFFLLSFNFHTSHVKWEHLLPLPLGAPLKDALQNKHLLWFPLNLAPTNFISPRSHLVYEKRQ